MVIIQPTSRSAAVSGIIPKGQTLADIGKLVQEKLNSLTKKGYPAIQVCLDSPAGRIVASSGLKDLQASRKISDDSKFCIGSVTKIFTSVMILQLVEEGRLSLDATVAKLLPDLAPGIEKADQITVADLLKHTSGIPDYRGHGPTLIKLLNEENPNWSLEDSIRAVAGEPNQNTGQEKTHRYSNTNYNILGLILERIDKKPLEQILQDRITTRLNMRDTQMGYPMDDSRFANGYSALANIPEPLRQDGFRRNIGPKDSDLYESTKVDASLHALADGGIVSTVSDLAIFADALFKTNKLLAPRTRDLLSSDKVASGEGGFYGYGIGVVDSQENGRVFSHAGATCGYQGDFTYYPKYGLTITALTNRDPISMNQLLGMDLQQELFGDSRIRDFFYLS